MSTPVAYQALVGTAYTIYFSSLCYNAGSTILSAAKITYCALNVLRKFALSLRSKQTPDYSQEQRDVIKLLKGDIGTQAIWKSAALTIASIMAGALIQKYMENPPDLVYRAFTFINLQDTRGPMNQYFLWVLS